jgi:two-component system response regulator YesN
MYRVLIVDDEEPVLESYEYMLKNALVAGKNSDGIDKNDDSSGKNSVVNHHESQVNQNFVLAGKARTGYEALKLIYETEPDLVFMDINIPGMDGLAVIEEVHEKFPLMVFILSTAYERFDLAQRAIPLGVFAYLVKPVSKKTFFTSLDNVRDFLEKREREKSAGSGSASGAGTGEAGGSGEESFLRETISKPLAQKEWDRVREQFSLSSDKGMILILETGDELMDKEPAAAGGLTEGPTINGPSAGELTAGEPTSGPAVHGPAARGNDWCAAFTEKLSLKYRLLCGIMQNHGIFLISGAANYEELEEQIKSAGSAAFAGRRWNYGLGGQYAGPELYRSREEALADLRKKDQKSESALRERLRIAQLRRRIGIGDEAEMKRLFTGLWEDAFAAGDFALGKTKMAGLFMLLIDDISGSWSGSPENGMFSPAEEIAALKDHTEWENWANGAFDRLLKEAALSRSGKFPLPLVKAISCIQDHYAEPLQLGTVADTAQVSPAYLSRLFSDHLKTNFVDYLTEFRIERSEKLIRESRLSIKEIAFAVGYQDPNYFSKIFRKSRGLSPTEFAASHAVK